MFDPFPLKNDGQEHFGSLPVGVRTSRDHTKPLFTGIVDDHKNTLCFKSGKLPDSETK